MESRTYKFRFSCLLVGMCLFVTNMLASNLSHRSQSKLDDVDNPLIEGYYADPEVLYSHKTGKYYIYPTSDGFHEWSGNFFKTFSSKDLKTWKDEGVIFDFSKDLTWAKKNAWAPTIIERKIKGKYRYFYYYSAEKKIGVAVGKSPKGPFKDVLGKPLIDYKPAGVRGGQQIDPDVFQDPVSGKYYIYWGCGYLAVAELNDDMISVKKETMKLITPKSPFTEGTDVFYRKGIYYFLWSENDTRSVDYRVRYAMAKSPMGPLQVPKDNLILWKRPKQEIYGTGHCAVLQLNGTDEWRIIYHRFHIPDAISMGWAAGYHREVCMDTLDFYPDGRIKVVVPNKGKKYVQSAIVNGVPWYDQNHNPVNAHGAGIIKDGDKYWLFGEYKSDTSNAFPGFGCYSSEDLVNWKFERVVLPVQKDGILGPNRVGERVKVMKCPKTGEYVMLMHADDMKYNDPHIGVATCKTINGDYQLKGTLRYKGQPIKRWDMGVFQDEDGKVYLLIHHGPIYRLSDDYLSVDTMIANVKGMGESPAMFKKNGMYYLLTSNLTSWERNDNYYFTSTNIAGPWKKQGLFCPEGSLTWNSQSTFVLMLPDGTPMYMGDRWSYPHQASCATYVWMPMKVDGERLSISDYWQSWNPFEVKRVDALEDAKVCKKIAFISNQAGKEVKLKFKGTHVALVGKTDSHGGYALVSIHDMKGKEVYSSLIDFYSKVPQEGIRVITPRLPCEKYTLTVKVTGERSNWTDKRKNLFGTDNCFVQLDNVYIFH